MTSIVDEITLKARSLPAEDRARLAEDLLSSLQEDHDLAIEAAWDTAIRRRLDEVEAGTATLIPAAKFSRKYTECSSEGSTLSRGSATRACR